MKQQSKRSYISILETDDLFLYAIDKEKYVYLIEKTLKYMDQFTDDIHVIEALYQLDLLSLYDKQILVKIIFDHQQIQHEMLGCMKDCEFIQPLRCFHSILKQRTKQYNDHGIEMIADQLLYQMKQYLTRDMNNHPINEMKVNLKLFSDINIHIYTNDVNELEWIDPNSYASIYYQSEDLLINAGVMIHQDEIYDTYARLFKMIDNKPIHISIPTFTTTKYLIVDPDFRTEVNQFSIEHIGLRHWISGMAKAIDAYHPDLTFIIPHLNSADDLLFWRTEIDILSTYLNWPIKTGMTIETESALQYCEDYIEIKPAFIKLDELINEYNDQSLSVSMLHKDMNIFIDDLKHMHYVYRVNQPKQHILCGQTLDNAVVLRKFLNMGFREFALPISSLHVALPVFEAWENTRGRYVKKEVKNNIYED